jgi:hypothetical protein
MLDHFDACCTRVSEGGVSWESCSSLDLHGAWVAAFAATRGEDEQADVLVQAAEVARNRPGPRVIGWRLDEPPIEALVVALGVVVGDVLSDDCTEVVLAQEHELAEIFALDGAHEAFSVRVQVGLLGGSQMGVTPADRRSAQKAAVYSGSRSRRRKRLPLRKPSSASRRLLASWSIHAPCGWRMMPAISCGVSGERSRT